MQPIECEIKSIRLEKEQNFFNKMSTTSQKHQDFIAEPMGEKEVTAIAGIGPVLGERLVEKGYDKVYIMNCLC